MVSNVAKTNTKSLFAEGHVSGQTRKGEAPVVEWYENEELAREFVDFLQMEFNIHSLMLHVGEIVKRLATASDEEKLAWRMWQVAQVNEQRGLYLKTDKQERLRKLLAMAADKCEYARQLMTCEARHDATLKNWIVQYARATPPKE